MGFDCAPVVLEALKNLLKVDNGVIRHSIFKLQDHPFEKLKKELHLSIRRQNLREKREKARKEEHSFMENLFLKKDT
jgi:ribosomal protein S6